MATPYLFCTDEPNDADLVRTLGPAAVALPAFTDCFFTSWDNLLVCVERKKIGDMANCINTGRFVAQMTTCKENGASVLVLILEGHYRRNPEDGALEIPVWRINPRTGKRAELWDPVKPATQFSRFSQYLWELSYLVGVHVLRSEDVRGTADLILVLFDWFQRPRHHSLEQFYVDPPEQAQLARPSLVRRIAKELDHIGWTRSAEVAKHFRSARKMINADEAEWLSVPGIGEKIAKSVVASLVEGEKTP